MYSVYIDRQGYVFEPDLMDLLCLKVKSCCALKLCWNEELCLAIA